SAEISWRINDPYREARFNGSSSAGCVPLTGVSAPHATNARRTSSIGWSKASASGSSASRALPPLRPPPAHPSVTAPPAPSTERNLSGTEQVIAGPHCLRIRPDGFRRRVCSNKFPLHWLILLPPIQPHSRGEHRDILGERNQADLAPLDRAEAAATDIQPARD